MEFYRSCFGGELGVTKVGDTPMKGHFPASKHNPVINARLNSGQIEISATDWMASPEFDILYGIYGQFYDRYGFQWIFKGNPRASKKDQPT